MKTMMTKTTFLFSMLCAAATLTGCDDGGSDGQTDAGMRYHVHWPKDYKAGAKMPAICILHGSNMVFQILLSKTRDAVPLVRDFITDDERAIRSREANDASGVVRAELSRDGAEWVVRRR